MPKLATAAAPDGHGEDSLWHRFVAERFPTARQRNTLRKALRCTFDRDHERRTTIWVVGPSSSGKSALIAIVRRACQSLGVPPSHVRFLLEHTGPLAPEDRPTVLWMEYTGTRRPKTEDHQAEHITLDLRRLPARTTTSFVRDVATLDVLRWMGDRG